MPTRRKVDPEKVDPSGANAGRKERAEAIETANEAAEEKDKAAQAAAKASGLHEAKLDDAGARAQQVAAEENAPLEHLDDNEGPPVVAPIVEDSSEGKFKILGPEDKVTKGELQTALADVRIVGEDFPHPGEVIVDVSRPAVGDHHRVSAYTYDGSFTINVSGLLTGPGDWEFFVDSPVTQVGEGRDDHLPVIRRRQVTKFEVK